MEQDDDGALAFTYGTAYLAEGEPRPVSFSMPLREGPYGDLVARPSYSGLLPDALSLYPPGKQPPLSNGGIWRHLYPWQGEVADESYYGDGRIAILIIFESTQHGDFPPAIETAEGSFVDCPRNLSVSQTRCLAR